MLVAVLGGLLGILMMIPLRRALIVAQHGKLKYPEGTACAEVLKAGASAESRAAASPQARAEEARRGGSALSARTIFTGFGVGLAYKTAMVALKGWKDVPEKVLRRALQGRLDLGRDLARAARRRLHHRAAHRRDHVRGRRARLPGAHPGDQVLRRGHRRAARARHDAHRARWARAQIRGAYVLYIGAGRGGGGRHHQPAPLAARHLARRARGAARRGRSARRGGDDGPAHRARPAHELGRRRHRRPGAGHRAGAARCT